MLRDQVGSTGARASHFNFYNTLEKKEVLEKEKCESAYVRKDRQFYL